MLDFIQKPIVADFRQPSFSIDAFRFWYYIIQDLKLTWKHAHASAKSSPAFRKAVRKRLDKEQIVHGVAPHPRAGRCRPTCKCFRHRCHLGQTSFLEASGNLLALTEGEVAEAVLCGGRYRPHALAKCWRSLLTQGGELTPEEIMIWVLLAFANDAVAYHWISSTKGGVLSRQ